jgi:hypothetical protein
VLCPCCAFQVVQIVHGHAGVAQERISSPAGGSSGRASAVVRHAHAAHHRVHGRDRRASAAAARMVPAAPRS